jgi:hypothetical protein
MPSAARPIIPCKNFFIVYSLALPGAWSFDFEREAGLSAKPLRSRNAPIHGVTATS